MSRQWMIYGATGYTGTLIAEEAAHQGLRPVLAGRNEGKLAPLAEKLNLPYRVFSLDDPGEIRRHLAEVDVVLHCAGPFSATARPMVEACLDTHTHYLDITGEIPVFEWVHGLDKQAREAGVILCPGVGFDVIPTDCLAAILKEALPDATHLALGFDSRSTPSAGTAKTSIEGIALGGRVRREGKIVSVPLAYAVRRIDFGNGEKTATTIPWGDVSTAYYTTGIPNIEVYIPLSPRAISRIRRLRMFQPLLKPSPIQAFLKRQAEKKFSGPDKEERRKANVYVWGEVRNPAGAIKAARFVTANGYEVTRYGAIEVVKFLLQHTPDPGSITPSRLMDKELVFRLPGTSPLEWLS